jgi:hypothetical protein
MNGAELRTVQVAHVRMPLLGWCWLTLTVGLLAVFPGSAQEGQPVPPPAPTAASEAASPQLPNEEVAPAALVAPKLNADLLDEVQDGKLIPEEDVKDPPPEAKAYYEALIQARQTAPEVLAKSARRDLTYAHLFQEPWKYRGDVVRIEGEIARVRRFDPPKFFADGANDIHDLYEGWIFTVETNFANPMVVIFTELPAGLPVKERTDRLVSFDGYFFKKWPYKDAAGQNRIVPLLIGRTVQLRKAPVAPSAVPLSQFLGTAFLVLLGLLVLSTAGLTWWYRRGDRRIHKVLDAARSVTFPEPTFEQPQPEAVQESLTPLAEPAPDDDWPVQPRNRLEDRPRRPNGRST